MTTTKKKHLHMESDSAYMKTIGLIIALIDTARHLILEHESSFKYQNTTDKLTTVSSLEEGSCTCVGDRGSQN